jgi:DNA-binding GntR family transcriptional regulator
MLPGVTSILEPARAKAMEQALERLRALIVTGELSPGEQIRQQETADQLGFSRVPLREALNVLADQGLLLHRPHQGYFVAKRAPSELAQIRRMLQLLEDELLEAMEWPDPPVLKELKKLNQEMRKHAAAAEWMPLMRKNREFHFRIFGLSPHRIILDEIHRLWVLGEPFIALRMSSPEARLRTVDEHDEIIRTLEKRDRKQLISAMEKHRASTSTGLPPEL